MLHRHHRRTGYAFVLPALIFMLLMFGYPVLYNIWLGFTDSDIKNFFTGQAKWVGFANWATLWGDLLPTALRQTFVYTVMSMVFQFSIGFLLALLFTQPFALAGRIRGALLICWMVPPTVVAMLYRFMLSPSIGIFNHLLLKVGLIHKPIEWLLNESTALWGVVMANIWVGIPFNMILLVAGLVSLPIELYESAKIDGANFWQRFVSITLPLLRSTILAVLILGFIYTFKVFDLVYVMTNGGPVNATEVMSTYSYRLSFVLYHFGEGAAAANTLFLLLLCVSIAYLALMARGEEGS